MKKFLFFQKLWNKTSRGGWNPPPLPGLNRVKRYLKKRVCSEFAKLFHLTFVYGKIKNKNAYGGGGV